MLTVFALIFIIALAAFIKSAIGVGEAVLAVPLLSQLVGIRVAIPLMGLVSLTLVVLLLVRNHRDIEFSTVRDLFVGCVFGIPVGLFFLKTAPEAMLLFVLGLLLVFAGGLNLVTSRIQKLGARIWPSPFGFVAGAFTAAYAIGGPPIFLFGALKGWDSKQFRVSAQSFFLPLSTIVVSGHGVSGLWCHEVFGFYLMALPGVLMAFLLGNRIGRSLKQETFKRTIYLFLILQGGLLVVQNISALWT